MIALLVAAVVAAIWPKPAPAPVTTRPTPPPPATTPMPAPTFNEPETWEAWIVDERRFSLVFPTKPSPIESGILGSHGYESYRSNSSTQYLAIFVASWGGPPDEALATLRDAIAKGNPLVSDRKLNAGGLAEEFVYLTDAGMSRCRAMLAGARSCLTCVKGTTDDDGALTFFSSLRLLGPGASAPPRPR